MKCSCASILFRRCTRFCMHTEFFFEEGCTQNFLPVELASLEQNNNQGFLLDHHTRWIQYTIPTFFFFEMNHLKLQWIFCYKFSWSSLIIEIQYDIWLATNPVSSTPKITRRLCSNRKLVHVAGAWLGFDLFFKRFSRVYGSASFQVRVILWSSCFFFLKFDSDKHTFCLLYLGSWEIHWWHIWFTIF